MVEVDALAMRQGRFRLDGVTFSVPKGSYAVLMGRSGGGKTTVLEAVAGLRRPHAGRVLLRGVDVTAAAPAARKLGYVPQDGAVFGFMTVAENLGFALSVARRAPAEIRNRVGELAGWLGLGSILGRRAVGLSGGEAKRVAFGRALAIRPDVLLLDEPLAAIDEETHDGLIGLLDGVRQSRAATVIHVTHSRAEAERLADIILELGAGGIVAAAPAGSPG